MLSFFCKTSCSEWQKEQVFSKPLSTTKGLRNHGIFHAHARNRTRRCIFTQRTTKKRFAQMRVLKLSTRLTTMKMHCYRLPCHDHNCPTVCIDCMSKVLAWFFSVGKYIHTSDFHAVRKKKVMLKIWFAGQVERSWNMFLHFFKGTSDKSNTTNDFVTL